MNLNKAFVLGNVTRDPEVRALPSGQQVVSFSIATNRFYTDNTGQKKQEAEFHNIVCFGKLADISARYSKAASPDMGSQKSDDIPVIEENSPSSFGSSEPSSDEIDVKDIPF